MKKILITGFAALIASFSANVLAVDLDWQGNSTVIIDNTVQVTKPSKSWDTQRHNPGDDAPVKWVRHVNGSNPQIFLRYKDNVKGQTAHDYAKFVRSELASRGIKVTKTENKVLNGRHVAVIHGKKGTENYTVGVWRHKDKGFQLESVVEDQFVSRFKGDVDAVISSVKILKEQGL